MPRLSERRNDAGQLGLNMKYSGGTWYKTDTPPPEQEISCEVVGFSCNYSESDDDNTGRVLLLDHQNRKIYQIWKRDSDGFFWIFERAAEFILGEQPVMNNRLQAPNGYTPPRTVLDALGTFIQIRTKQNGQYVNFDVIGGPFNPPEGVLPMFGSDGKPTGNQPTNVDDLFARGRQQQQQQQSSSGWNNDDSF